MKLKTSIVLLIVGLFSNIGFATPVKVVCESRPGSGLIPDAVLVSPIYPEAVPHATYQLVIGGYEIPKIASVKTATFDQGKTAGLLVTEKTSIGFSGSTAGANARIFFFQVGACDGKTRNSKLFYGVRQGKDQYSFVKNASIPCVCSPVGSSVGAKTTKSVKSK